MAGRGRQTGSGGGVWKRHFPEAVFHRGLTPRTRAPPQGPKRPKTPHLLIPSHWGLGLRHTSFGGDTRGLQHVHSERVRTCVCFSSGQRRPEVDLCNDRTLTVTTLRTRNRSVTTRTPPARLYLALAADPCGHHPAPWLRRSEAVVCNFWSWRLPLGTVPPKSPLLGVRPRGLPPFPAAWSRVPGSDAPRPASLFPRCPRGSRFRRYRRLVLSLFYYYFFRRPLDWCAPDALLVIVPVF